MRRSALPFTIPLACALLGLMLVGASGNAQEAAPPTPQLAMAVTPVAPVVPVAPTTRPAPAAEARVDVAEMLISSAPVKVEARTVSAAYLPPKPRVVMMEVTAYCPCKKCCGPKAQGITASGKRVSHNGGLFVAADKAVFDFNTLLRIPGYANGRPVPVLDRGGAIKGNKLDVFFPSHTEALKWGRQKIAVTVLD